LEQLNLNGELFVAKSMLRLRAPAIENLNSPHLMNPPGSETGAGQLVTPGKSIVCSVDAFGFKFQWTTDSSKHIPFDWTGPSQFAPLKAFAKEFPARIICCGA
jgi:hypothetical protein